MIGKQVFFTLVVILLAVASGCGPAQGSGDDDTNSYPETIANHRAETAAYFAGSDSPIPDSARAHFKGVQYYPIDTQYRVQAEFVPQSNGPIFTIQATGKIADVYQTVGRLQFTLAGTACTLEVYKNVTAEQESGTRYYFIPFFDLTNGEETYGGGRYLDMDALRPGHIELDFNLAYQPYCYYNHAYSCPIPPLVNTLPVAVRAGERM